MAGIASAGPTRRSKISAGGGDHRRCLIGVITFGPRSAIGQFQLPILGDFTLGSDVFSFAMALQYLFWGLGQPFAGAMADKYGTTRVLTFGAVFYALGLSLMAWASTPLSFTLTAGVLLGLGISAARSTRHRRVLRSWLPPERPPFAFGLGTAAGSFGQFLFSPFAGAMISATGWMPTVFTFLRDHPSRHPAVVGRWPRATTASSPQAGDAPKQSFREAISEAFKHRSYVLLVIGFFTCGFQLAFVTVHFQRYVVEAGLPAHIGYWAFALVGIFNIVGSLCPASWATRCRSGTS